MLMFYMSVMETPEERQWITNIYEEYHSFAIHIANNILHNYSDAEDAVHNAFLDVIAQKEKLIVMECSVFRPTFVVIVKHKAIDILRKSKRRKVDDIPVEEHINISSKEDVVIQMINKERYQELFEAIKRIPVQYQEILQLKYFSGMSNTELSKILDIKLKNVETRLNRAKLALKKEVDGRTRFI